MRKTAQETATASRTLRTQSEPVREPVEGRRGIESRVGRAASKAVRIDALTVVAVADRMPERAGSFVGFALAAASARRQAGGNECDLAGERPVVDLDRGIVSDSSEFGSDPKFDDFQLPASDFDADIGRQHRSSQLSLESASADAPRVQRSSHRATQRRRLHMSITMVPTGTVSRGRFIA